MNKGFDKWLQSCSEGQVYSRGLQFYQHRASYYTCPKSVGTIPRRPADSQLCHVPAFSCLETRALRMSAGLLLWLLKGHLIALVFL